MGNNQSFEKDDSQNLDFSSFKPKKFLNKIPKAEKQLIKDCTLLMAKNLCQTYRSLILTYSYILSADDIPDNILEDLHSNSYFIIWLGNLKKLLNKQKKELKNYKYTLLNKIWPEFEKTESQFTRDIKLLLDSSPEALNLFFKDIKCDWSLNKQLEQLVDCFDLKKNMQSDLKIVTSARDKIIMNHKRENSSLTHDRNVECRPIHTPMTLLTESDRKNSESQNEIKNRFKSSKNSKSFHKRNNNDRRRSSISNKPLKDLRLKSMAQIPSNNSKKFTNKFSNFSEYSDMQLQKNKRNGRKNYSIMAIGSIIPPKKSPVGKMTSIQEFSEVKIFY